MTFRTPVLAALLLGAAAPDDEIKILFLGDQGHHRPEERFRQLQPVLAACGISLTQEKRADLKPFEYQDANVPFYAGSHKLGEPWRKMQKPVDPAESAKHVEVPAGFESRLFASEPEITKPIALAWDARGRLWISESVDYPNEMKPEGEGRDRIRICEDTDGDGRADKFTVFAEKLSIPTSLCPVEGGVIVVQAPHTLLLRDTDGDDKADERKVLFSGWGTGDTHAGPSNLRWGFDNWVWGIVGYSGFNGKVGAQEHRFSMGFFRFRPDGSDLEFIRSTNNNSWGLGLSEEGIVFGSTANGNPSEYMPIANRYYERVGGWTAARLNGISDNDPFHPVTAKVRQVDHHGRFTAAAGHALYTARLFPKEYWNRAAFVCEPTGHLCAVFQIRAEGANFRSNTTHNLFASDDEWTAPIAAEVGPDGAVWVLDWYNYIVQHNPVPAGFKNGRGNAYEIDLRDKTHGRVYRVFPRGAAFPKPPALATTADQVAALGNDNLLWRMHAQRLLVQRRDKAAKGALEAHSAAPAATHALRALDGLGILDPAFALAALKHASAGVRRNALEVLPREASSVAAVLPLLEDADAQVRLAALLTLSELPPSKEAGAAILAALRNPVNADDKWLPDAVTGAAARHDAGFLAAALAGLKTDGVAAPQASRNLIVAGAFEASAGWRKVTYAGRAEHSIDANGRSGKCAKIVSTQGSDASWSTTVKVTPGSRYRLTAWVKTNGLAKNTGRGALLNIHELQPEGISAPVTGTTDWTKLETEFEAPGVSQITVNCLFGGWGQSKGEAWWDDVSLVELTGRSLKGKAGAVVTTVTRSYARRGPAESVLDLLASLKAADPSLAGFLLEGLASGWPRGRAPEIAAAGKASLTELFKSLPLDGREHLLALADRWERKDLFDRAPIAALLAAAVADGKRPADERASAARRLLRLDDRPETVRAVLAPLSPLAPPALSTGLVEALTESRHAETGSLLLDRWADLTPVARARAVGVLLRQGAWTAALLDRVERRELQAAELAAEHWQQLRNHPEKPVADRAAKLSAAGPGAVSPDREALYAKLLPAADRAGDAVRGKELYTQLCSKCHALAGTGGRVGPDLTGIGARAKKEILLEIVDPNRSVEANFRVWMVKTKDGQVLSGRMDSETQTSIELLDVEGKSHAVQRQDIEALKGSTLSIMPTGLVDALPEADVAALLEFLSLSREAPAKKK